MHLIGRSCYRRGQGFWNWILLRDGSPLFQVRLWNLGVDGCSSKKKYRPGSELIKVAGVIAGYPEWFNQSNLWTGNRILTRRNLITDEISSPWSHFQGTTERFYLSYFRSFLICLQLPLHKVFQAIFFVYCFRVLLISWTLAFFSHNMAASPLNGKNTEYLYGK